MKFRIIIILTIALGVAGCSRFSRISGVDLAAGYNPALSFVHPVYDIYHPDEETSIVTVHVSNYELQYERDQANDFFFSRFRVNLMIYDSFESRRPLYNQNVLFTDTLLADELRMVSRKIFLPLSTGKDYIFYLQFEDLNNRSRHETIKQVEKRNLFVPGFFNVIKDETPISSPYFASPGSELTLYHYQLKEFRMDAVRYRHSGELPVAPYVIRTDNPGTEAPIPEITTTLPFRSGLALFTVPEAGFYRISAPGDQDNGFPILSFWKGFPEYLPDELFLAPLRYLTSADEYSKLTETLSPRVAALQFWNRTTTNPDRAYAVMQRYNSRVIEANTLFSSSVAGWKTDKGMIYIVYGAPDRVFAGSNSETWLYSGNINTPEMQFRFNRLENEISGNHYILERDLRYRQSWNQAVERWRR
jgi:GWxTD domain-containing protein